MVSVPCSHAASLLKTALQQRAWTHAWFCMHIVLLACRYVALEEVAGAADDDARRFGGFHSSWRQQIADELRITRSRDRAQA